MTQVKLIEKFTKRLNDVISAHGADSDYTTHAFFLLQGAKMGLSTDKVFTWANNKVEELHKETLELV